MNKDKISTRQIFDFVNSLDLGLTDHEKLALVGAMTVWISELK